MRGGWVVGALLALAILMPTPPAVAENRDAARTAYDQGRRYYDLTQFERALEAFQRAYWNYEEPAFLFNIAQCYRQLSRKPEAVATYRSYLRKAGDAPNRDEVQRIIGELQAALALDVKTITPAATTAPTPAASAASPSLAAVALQPERRPLAKKAWFWAALSGAAVVVGGAIALGIVFGSSTTYPRASVATIPGD